MQIMPSGRRPSSVPTLPPHVGRVLATLALEIAGTQSAAANLVGENQSSWSRLKTGERLLSERQLGEALTKLGVSRDDFDRRLASYSLQSPSKGKIRWVVPPRRANGEILAVDDVLSLAGVTTEGVFLPTNTPGPLRGADSQDGSALAQRVRSAWGLGAFAPIADLSIIFGSRAVVLLPSDILAAGAGRLKVKTGMREVVVVPDRMSAADQRWAALRMFALLRRRSVHMPPESFLQDFTREFLIPKTAVRMLLRPFVKLPDPQPVAEVATTLLSQHFGAPVDEVAKMVAVELRLSEPPEAAPITAGPAGSSPWLTLLRAADSEMKQLSKGHVDGG